MATSLQELVSFLDELEFPYTVLNDGEEPLIRVGFGTSTYRSPDGAPGVQLGIELTQQGEYLEVLAPNAYDLSECEYKSAALEVFAGIEYRVKMIRFEYDAEDGEVRLSVGLALEDATLTVRQLKAHLVTIPLSLDACHNLVVQAMETGVDVFEGLEEDAGSQEASFDIDALSEFTELSEGAAAILGECRTDLDLSGLQTITAADVRALSQKPWSGTESWWHTFDLDLSGLTTLPLDVAEALAQRFDELPNFMTPASLRLDGIEALTAEVARAIARYPGDLSLNGLLTIDADVASALASHRADLELDGLRSIDAATATALGRHRGDLMLNGLTELDETSASELARCQGHIQLGGLKALSAEVAKALATHEGDLRLDSVACLSDAAAEALASHRGVLDLEGLRELSPAAARHLVTHVGTLIICLDDLATDVRDILREHPTLFTDEPDVPSEEEEETQSSEPDWGDTARQDQLIADDVAELADLLRRGVSRKDWLAAHVDRVSLWRKAAERGSPHGLMIIGSCHLFGVGREEAAPDAARPFFEQAASKGEPQAQLSLGDMSLIKALNAEGTETLEDAYRWFLASAESGLAQAQFSVGRALWKGEGIEEDERAAVEWMGKAAAQGHGEAAFTLAQLHLASRLSAGIKRNREKAIAWGRTAAAAGYEKAQEWLAKHERGLVLTTEIADAIHAHWQENSDEGSFDSGEDDAEDDDAPPTPSGPFADPQGTVTNSLGMKLVPIAAGEFLMGSPEDCPLGDADEEFQHRVRITKPFLLGMHQVTQSQYEQVTGENPSFFKGPDLPVEHLTWREAQHFCELLSDLAEERAAGRRYRLPTEAEWEFACRAGTTTPFHTGDSLEPDQARFASTSRSSPKQTAPVGTYPPNAWGLFDMHGNVWEWTSDWFSADYFHESPVDDPQGPSSGTHHTLRGGSASVEDHECRSTIRGEADAVDGPETDTHNRYSFYGDFGIRVVCQQGG